MGLVYLLPSCSNPFCKVVLEWVKQVPKHRTSQGIWSKNGLYMHLMTIPQGSMYGIFTYIYHKNQPNVAKYTIHGGFKHFIVSPLPGEMFQFDSYFFKWVENHQLGSYGIWKGSTTPGLWGLSITIRCHWISLYGRDDLPHPCKFNWPERSQGSRGSVPKCPEVPMGFLAVLQRRLNENWWFFLSWNPSFVMESYFGLNWIYNLDFNCK